MAHDLEFGADAVAPVHIARDPRDIERLAAIVALYQADRLGDKLAVLEAPPDAERGLQPKTDLGRHVGELQLDQLIGGEGAAELLAVERVAARGGVAGLRRAHRSPADPVSGAVEAAERALEPTDVGQKRILADLDLVHHDFAGDRRA